MGKYHERTNTTLTSQLIKDISGGVVRIKSNSSREALGIYNMGPAVKVGFNTELSEACVPLASGAYWDFYNGNAPQSEIVVFPTGSEVHLVILSNVMEVTE